MENVGTWYEEISYGELKRFISANLSSVAREFVALGYYLKDIRDRELYREDGYESIWEFAEDQYGIGRSTCSRWMAINDRFSEGGNSPALAKEYRDYGKSQLQEMLYLEDAQMEQVTPEMTVKEIREIRRPEVEPEDTVNYQEKAEAEDNIPGQMVVEDYPEVMPEPCATSHIDNSFMNLPEAEDDVVLEAPEPDTVADAEYEEIEAGEDDVSDLDLLREELHRQKSFLARARGLGFSEDDIEIRKIKLMVGALAGMLCDLDQEDVDQPEIEQPELPVLKNDDQRKAFVDAYETWPIWIDTKETGERYYRYDFPNGTSFVVKVYYHQIFDHKIDAKRWEDRYHPGWGRPEYYVLTDGKYFKDCENNRSFLVDYLKAYQKGEK